MCGYGLGLATRTLNVVVVGPQRGLGSCGMPGAKYGKWVQRNLFPCCFGRSCLIPNQGYLSGLCMRPEGVPRPSTDPRIPPSESPPRYGTSPISKSSYFELRNPLPVKTTRPRAPLAPPPLHARPPPEAAASVVARALGLSVVPETAVVRLRSPAFNHSYLRRSDLLRSPPPPPLSPPPFGAPPSCPWVS